MVEVPTLDVLAEIYGRWFAERTFERSFVVLRPPPPPPQVVFDAPTERVAFRAPWLSR